MSDEKTHVVVKDGKRASDNLTEDEAKKKAEALRSQLQESGTAQSQVVVKQALNG